MITKITGKLQAMYEDALALQVGPMEYEVLIPDFARRQLQGSMGQEITLFTIDYLEGNAMQGRLVPRMIGFLNEVEREFFEMICSVDGVGVKKALRAMVRPVREFASAIEEQDIKFLAALPGIGPATAERMIAKLRRKVPKFALMVGRDEPTSSDTPMDIVRETYEVLKRLGHSDSDARRLLDGVIQTKKKFQDVQQLLQAVYDNSRKG